MTKRKREQGGQYRAVVTVWHSADGRHYEPGETFCLSHQDVVHVAKLVSAGMVEALPGTERPRLAVERAGVGLEKAVALWKQGIRTVEDLVGVSAGRLMGLGQVGQAEALAWQEKALAWLAEAHTAEEGNDGANGIDGAEH